jgi:hypothetical protein
MVRIESAKGIEGNTPNILPADAGQSKPLAFTIGFPQEQSLHLKEGMVEVSKLLTGEDFVG